MDLRNKMGENGKHVIKSFDIKELIKKYDNIYLKLLDFSPDGGLNENI